MSWAVRKKYRDLLDREDGHEKKLWGDALAIGLAYPNRYRTGMDNLGFQTVYRLLNRHPAVLCERFFLPDPGDEAAFSPGPLPLFSLESQRPLRDFDVVAFSLSFENDYPHVLKMLSLGGIPLLSRERNAGDPLVMGGGICATMNPEPLAIFFDLFLIGEAEALLPAFLAALLARRDKGEARNEMLAGLQREVPGAYIPHLYEISYRDDGTIAARKPTIPELPLTTEKMWVENINEFSTESAITTPETDFGTMYLTEISRGCGRGCRFCAAGYLCRPVRFRRRKNLRDTVARGLAKGLKIGLIGTAVSDHPELAEICREIISRQGRFGVASVRLDRISPALISLFREGGIETLALAPEAGSQRLRDLIRKGITEDDILRAAVSLLQGGFDQVRLYFLIGLPTETATDIAAIIDMVRHLSRLTVKAGPEEKRFQRLTVSLNQFIPKAGTPFQWYPLEDIRMTEKKIKTIAASFRGQGNIKITAEPSKGNYLQALFAVGDRRVGSFLLALHQRGGNWPPVRKESSLNPDFFVYRHRKTDEVLPWDFIATGVPKSSLLKEYQDSQGEREKKSC
ncbi:MAG TPA: radical SAM protein [Syntrophales bacterium]|nr:radical SAM protein [Syntrophales bacterium]